MSGVFLDMQITPNCQSQCCGAPAFNLKFNFELTRGLGMRMDLPARSPQDAAPACPLAHSQRAGRPAPGRLWATCHWHSGWGRSASTGTGSSRLRGAAGGAQRHQHPEPKHHAPPSAGFCVRGGGAQWPSPPALPAERERSTCKFGPVFGPRANRALAVHSVGSADARNDSEFRPM